MGENGHEKMNIDEPIVMEHTSQEKKEETNEDQATTNPKKRKSKSEVTGSTGEVDEVPPAKKIKKQEQNVEKQDDKLCGDTERSEKIFFARLFVRGISRTKLVCIPIDITRPLTIKAIKLLIEEHEGINASRFEIRNVDGRVYEETDILHPQWIIEGGILHLTMIT